MDGSAISNVTIQNIPSIGFRMNHCLSFFCSHVCLDKLVCFILAHNMNQSTINVRSNGLTVVAHTSYQTKAHT